MPKIPKQRKQRVLCGDEDATRDEALADAAFHGNLAKVNALLCRGVDRNRALAAAIRKGHTPVVRRLLDAGATVSNPDVFLDAVRGNHVGTVRELLKSGGSVRTDIPTAFRILTIRDDLEANKEMIKVILTQVKPDPHVENSDLIVLYSSAVVHKRFNIMRLWWNRYGRHSKRLTSVATQILVRTHNLSSTEHIKSRLRKIVAMYCTKGACSPQEMMEMALDEPNSMGCNLMLLLRMYHDQGRCRDLNMDELLRKAVFQRTCYYAYGTLITGLLRLGADPAILPPSHQLTSDNRKAISDYRWTQRRRVLGWSWLARSIERSSRIGVLKKSLDC